jgi:hypothetical protein
MGSKTPSLSILAMLLFTSNYIILIIFFFSIPFKYYFFSLQPIHGNNTSMANPGPKSSFQQTHLNPTNPSPQIHPKSTKPISTNSPKINQTHHHNFHPKSTKINTKLAKTSTKQIKYQKKKKKPYL